MYETLSFILQCTTVCALVACIALCVLPINPEE